jgi:hypothetical protein
VARRLDLHFAEFTLRCVQGRWMAVDLYPHLTVSTLAVSGVLDAACGFLEGEAA